MKPNLDSAASLLLRIGKRTCASLVHWLSRNANGRERIKAYEWLDDLWYVEVQDTRIKEYPYNMLLGFTVDIAKDFIFWSNSRVYSDRFKNGGNCFCRSERWWRLIRKDFPQAKSDLRRDGTRDRVGTVHDYRPRKKGVKAHVG